MRFWALARYDLRLSDAEFCAITPRQLDALLKRRRVETECTELLFGQLTSWIANTGFRTAEKPTTPTDFMPSQWAKVRAISREDRQQALTDAFRLMFPPRK